MTPTTIHNQTYEYYSWETLGEDIFELARDIITAGHEFDRVIALAKGGLTFSRSLVDYLQVEDISSIKIEFYTNIGVTADMPVITQSLPVSIRDERILVFDDIVDSGATLELAINYLKQHGCRSIHSATLLQKPWTKYTADFAARTSEAWVIFPNEVRETITLLRDKWLASGDSMVQIEEQLLQIGFGKAEVELFLNLQ